MIDRPGRNADVYVLGLHDITDETADHREPSQWSFFVICAHKLSSTKRLGHAGAKLLVESVRIDGLAEAVATARAQTAAAKRLTWEAGDLKPVAN